MIKDTGEPPDEEIHRARSERFPGAGALSPGIGVCHRLHKCVCSPVWKLVSPHMWGSFMEASSCRHNQRLIHSAAPLQDSLFKAFIYLFGCTWVLVVASELLAVACGT